VLEPTFVAKKRHSLTPSKVAAGNLASSRPSPLSPGSTHGPPWSTTWNQWPQFRKSLPAAPPGSPLWEPKSPPDMDCSPCQDTLNAQDNTKRHWESPYANSSTWLVESEVDVN